VEYFGPLEKITVADYERVFGINVGGQLFITQAAVARMERGADRADILGQREHGGV
jgi:NAD(P)-dependent dehydrogenase (short-subunit alcohol dehydrogenase family)